MQPAVDRFPALSAIIGAKRTGGRDRDGYSFWIVRVEKNRVQTHPARAWLPFRTGVAPAQSGEFVPGFSAVFRFEQRGVFHACINVIGIMKRRFQMPDALELPRMLRAVVPLMCCEWFASFSRSIVHELVALASGRAIRAFQFLGAAAGRVPGFAAVV